jgi:phosphoenolpyruvate synthase/pyruvate phosphate dikinase
LFYCLEFEPNRKVIKELILSCDIPSEIEERIKEAYIKLISQSQIELHSNLNKYRPNVAVRSSATAEDLPDALSVSDQLPSGNQVLEC